MPKNLTPEEIAELQAIAAASLKPLNTRIPVRLHNDLKKLAAHEEITLQELVTEILTRSVNARLSKIKKSAS